MAQYDVYVNPDPATRERVPYVVDVQSNVLDHLNTRLMMPLRRPLASHAGLPRRLLPRLRVGGETYVLHAHQAAVVEARLFKKAVGSVASQAFEIVDALDAVISGV